MPDPNGAREFVGVSGPVVGGTHLTAMVYESPGGMTGYAPSYYFCCSVCGNCGRHWLDPDYATVQAAHHLFYFDHTDYLENDDDPSDRRSDSRAPQALLPAPDGGGTGDDGGAPPEAGSR